MVSFDSPETTHESPLQLKWLYFHTFDNIVYIVKGVKMDNIHFLGQKRS